MESHHSLHFLFFFLSLLPLDSLAFDLGSPAPAPTSGDSHPGPSPALGPSSEEQADPFLSPGLPAIESIEHFGVSHHPAADKICGTTDYPDLCFPVIIPALRGGKTDLHVVVETAIKATVAHTELAVATASKLLSQAPPELKTALEDCKSSYDDAIDNLQKAMDGLKTNDIGKVNTMLSAAITFAGDCTDGLEGENSPLIPLNKKLKHMTSNCLAIVAFMHGDSPPA